MFRVDDKAKFVIAAGKVSHERELGTDYPC
jgi:hypothetical protein